VERARHGTTDREHEDDDTGLGAPLRLGEDVRWVLAAVGGGAVRIGREIAQRRVPFLETVAINCDARVQEPEEFDRRLYLGPPGAPADGSEGSAALAGRLARSAEPALERVFDGATIVTIVASLGGGAGTGALPCVVDAASRCAEFVTVFVVKPFDCEGERRATAERAIARLHFLESFIGKRESHHATLHVLDNQLLARRHPEWPFRRVERHWGELVARHVEEEFVRPFQTAVRRPAASVPDAAAPVRTPGPERYPVPPPPAEPSPGPMPIAPQLLAAPGDVELTFEILPAGPSL